MTGRRKISSFRALLLVIALVAGIAAAPASAKKGKSRTFEGSVVVNAPIPDRLPGSTPVTPVLSQITIPKKFKGKVVGDLNVTGIQTTGVGANPLDNLTAWLTAPSGRTLLLFSSALSGQNLGPFTIDDDTRVSTCDPPNASGPCSDPDATLLAPFAGTANISNLFNGTGPLSTFNGQKMRGTWTFGIGDFSNGQTSTLNGWGLKIKAAKPVPE
jgi:hypothetical protein